MEGGPDTLVSPCDGKLSVYPVLHNRDGAGEFCIKNTKYTVESLLRSAHLAKRYEGGYACVFRLTVDDYHRYCYIDDGENQRTGPYRESSTRSILRRMT